MKKISILSLKKFPKRSFTNYEAKTLKGHKLCDQTDLNEFKLYKMSFLAHCKMTKNMHKP